MQFCQLTQMYIDENHRIPVEAEYEANNKLQEFRSNNMIGSFLYADSLKEELKEKYKCRCSSDGRALR